MAQRGKVKWYRDYKGFGFITPDDGGAEVYLHHSAFQDEKSVTSWDGQAVEYDVVPTPRGPSAANVVAV